MRRWEIERGLPVHRVPGSSRGAVFAFTAELEEWLRRPQVEVEPGQTGKAIEKTISGSEPALKLVPPVSIDVSGSPAETANQDSEPTRRRFGMQLLPWIVAGTLAAGVFAAVYSYRQTAHFRAHASDGQVQPRTPGLGRETVAVLPFANLHGDAKTDYLSDGITESLIGDLAHIPQLRVRSRDSVFRYKGKDLDMPTIGTNLGASVLVSGRVMVKGDAIEVSTELTDVQTNTEIWGNRYTGKSADIILLQERMAGDIAQKLRSTLSTADRERVTNQGTQNVEAYSLYLKGRYAFYNRPTTTVQTAISYFNQAIAKDPDYALAYSGLADAYSVLTALGGNPAEDYPKSNAAARKALELDPTLAHPHAVLGSNEMGYDWDFAGGEAEFKKAIQLDPNDATAHQWYAERLGDMGGREQEAFAEINLAHQLDPQSPVIRRVMGSVLVAARRYDEAIVVCKDLLKDEPTYALAHDCLGYAYWGKRMYPQVVEEWKTWGRLTSVREDTELGDALDRGFRSGGWNGALTEAIQTFQTQHKSSYRSPYEIARLYADLGNKEKAFEWLDTAYREHDWLLMDLNTNFQVDSLRSDPRFAEMVRKIGLPTTIASASQRH